MKDITRSLEINADEARALLAAIEHAAYVAQGSGHGRRARDLWRVFQRIAAMHFIDIPHEVDDCLRGDGAEQ
jgi:hypothetical protein